MIGLPAVASAAADFEITPDKVLLQGTLARTQLLISERAASGRPMDSRDLSHRAQYQSARPEVASVGPTGEIVGHANGETAVSVTVEGITHTVPVVVEGILPEPVVSFDEQVMPVIARFGCSAGACHASQYGKGGFKLSVFTSEPAADHRAMFRDSQSRRLNFVDPAQSLLVLKANGSVFHGGGRRMKVGSPDDLLLTRWIASGAPGPQKDAPHVVSLAVQPPRRFDTEKFSQQLRVVARYSDGHERDVTAWAKFDSRDEAVVQVQPGGLAEVIRPGQGTVMIRYEGQATLMQVVVPNGPAVALPEWGDANLVDRFAAAKFRELGLQPAGLCDDATFLRRAFLDVIGTLPTPDETRAFLQSGDPEKRTKLIDRLLGLTGDSKLDTYNNAYAAYWSLKWSDLLRSSSKTQGEQGMWSMHNWLQTAFRENMRFNQFVRELITAKGSFLANGPANFFQSFGNAEDRSEAVAQVFLGVRLQCAKCHHHPFETISQEDYYRVAAHFARIGTKANYEAGVRHESGELVVLSKGESTHPKTGAVLPPTPLHGQPSPPSPDRRKPLADWLTANDNPYFARNIVNRYWAYLMGRGLVDPIDDMRATNPPTNPELLDALARDFVEGGYDGKRLLRLLLTSRLYQLDAKPPRPGTDDHRFYTHYGVKRMPAETLLDAIDVVTGVQTKFPQLPLGTRAIELPDSLTQNDTLVTFGKPKRESVCECERVPDPNLSQALHTLNSAVLIAKISDPKGRLATLMAAGKSHDEIVTDFYLVALSRFPTEPEQAACKRLADEAADKKLFYEDLLWSLINSKQFLFIR